ncbi:MAG: thioredoxin [Parcubacteria group bacterium CG1_02_37_51]|uniref:Thioredoxin n=2 Tax=Candidatus Komeiliibacteriota TaxID=1817908 RepID=A0A2M8DS68_9BACT|nr:MAG: thioredoxin [Parcubacteria group bacterium CG1_02_37_51]PIY95164.1 MAG: thioredoxin [Candidatus Komeilibacteria bacterium CG_4_10_14_0_8_um_filter_37_78]PJC02224.1 MAG: thioredoxin [Candidatus Komeilibacteria bacterium CG_4_9_14_0_8_um_filter_36_9]
MAEHVTDQNFEEEVLKAEQPVFVDFYASWCGPCKMMEPIIDELADEYKDKIKIVKLNVDENQVTAQKYQVMSIPTMLIYQKGEVMDQMVGFQEKSALKNKFDNLK